MATVRIPVNELTSFDLPKVCVVTGASDGVVFKPVKFQWYPPWVAVFACAPAIALVLMLILMKRAKGELPFTEAAHAAWQRGRLLLGASIVGAIVLFVVALTQSDQVPALIPLALVLCIAEPIVIGVVFLRNKGPRVKKIADGFIELQLPSQAATEAIAAHVSGARAERATAVSVS